MQEPVTFRLAIDQRNIFFNTAPKAEINNLRPETKLINEARASKKEEFTCH